MGHKSTCKVMTQFLSDHHNLDLMGEGEDTEEESEEDLEEDLEADGQTGTKNEGADNLEGEGEDQDNAKVRARMRTMPRVRVTVETSIILVRVKMRLRVRLVRTWMTVISTMTMLSWNKMQSIDIHYTCR